MNVTSTRAKVLGSASSLAFEAKSSLHPVHGKATDLGGYIDARIDGSALALDPPPAMHVEFAVEKLKSGNALQDQQMWKVIDSKRFALIAADLKKIEAASIAGTYAAEGDITLAGRQKRYTGALTIAVSDRRITVDGTLAIDIRDYGIKPPSLMGMIKVDPVVTVRLHLIAELES